MIVGHAHDYPEHEYHAEIGRRGAFVSFDGMSDRNRFLLDRDLRNIKKIVDAGYTSQLLLAHDVCLRSAYVSAGGDGYQFISTGLYPYLREIGITQEQFHNIMVDNPRRALTGED